MSTVVTVLVAFLGGGLGGSAISAGMAIRQGRTSRRGRARLLHEDFVRFQSTVTRLVYQTDKAHDWGERSWLLAPLTSPDAQQDVLAHLTGWRLSGCASALGWAEYLRGPEGRGSAPSDVELELIYRRLAGGRLAVADLAKLKYRPHVASHLVDKPTREPAIELTTIEEADARRDAEQRSAER
jgi:hypothetical protein